MRACLAVCACLALAGLSAADARAIDHVTWSKALSAPAQAIAGSLHEIDCATQPHALDQLNDGASYLPYAYTGGIGSSSAALSLDTCAALNGWRAGRRIAVPVFARSLFVLAHESELMLGISTEQAADCHALAALPALLSRWFPPKGRTTTAAVVAAARAFVASPSAPLGAHTC